MSNRQQFDTLARKALHTLWQTFLAVLGITWAASGLDVSQINDEASAKKFALAACAAVFAALLSAIKTTIAGLLTPDNIVGLNGSSGEGPLLDDGPPLPPLVTGTAAPPQRPHPMPGRHEA